MGVRAFVASLVLISVWASAKIRVRILSPELQETRSIKINTPYRIETVVEGSYQIDEYPVIQGLEAAEILQMSQSSNFYMVNGATKEEKVFTYLVKFSQAGTMCLGPVYVKVNGSVLQSEKLTIQVYELSEKEKLAARSPAVYVVCAVEKNEAFCGEEVAYHIRFYAAEDEAVTDVQLIPYEIPDCIVTRCGATQHIETIQGITYRVVEWSGTFVPQKVGVLRIPPVYVEYKSARESGQQRHHFAQFFSMFGSFLTPKKCSAPPSSIDILPLPPINNEVAGVGIISRVERTVGVLQVTVGKPIVCSVDVEGIFYKDVLRVPAPLLSAALRVYAPKIEFHEQKEFKKVTYEYIMQCLEPGKQIIAEQKFVFFNPQTKKYEEFVVPEITLTVVAEDGAHHTSLTSTQKDEGTAGEAPELNNKRVDFFDPLSKKIPILLPVYFFIMLIIPVIWFFTQNIVRGWYRKIRKRYVNISCLKNTKIALRRAAQRNDVGAFMESWITMTNEIVSLEQGASPVSDALVQRLLAMGFRETDVARWRRVWHGLSERLFSGQGIHGDISLLLIDALHCIKVLEAYYRK